MELYKENGKNIFHVLYSVANLRFGFRQQQPNQQFRICSIWIGRFFGILKFVFFGKGHDRFIKAKKPYLTYFLFIWVSILFRKAYNFGVIERKRKKIYIFQVKNGCNYK